MHVGRLMSSKPYLLSAVALIASISTPAFAAGAPDAPAQASEAQQSSPQDMPGDAVIFYRPIPGFDRIRPPLSPDSQRGLVGDTFAWYPYCDLDSTAQTMCISFPDNGGPPGYGDEEKCMVKQDQIHTTYLAIQSTRYTGKADFFQKPGETVRMPACRPETIGRGFSCFGQNAVCYTVESETMVLRAAKTSECMVENAGDFSQVLAIFGLTEPGPSFDPDTVCKASPTKFYGRKESCGWGVGDNGNMTIRPEESCFSVDTLTMVATEVAAPFCRDYVPALAEGPVIDDLLKKALMVKGSLPFSLNCGQDDQGKLVTRKVSDKPGETPQGKQTRTIDYEFSCTVSGSPAASSACSGAISAWTSKSAAFAADNGLSLTVEPGVLKKREIYTEM